jgi:hypothetical protein
MSYFINEAWRKVKRCKDLSGKFRAFFCMTDFSLFPGLKPSADIMQQGRSTEHIKLCPHEPAYMQRCFMNALSMIRAMTATHAIMIRV